MHKPANATIAVRGKRFGKETLIGKNVGGKSIAGVTTRTSLAGSLDQQFYRGQSHLVHQFKAFAFFWTDLEQQS